MAVREVERKPGTFDVLVFNTGAPTEVSTPARNSLSSIYPKRSSLQGLAAEMKLRGEHCCIARATHSSAGICLGIAPIRSGWRSAGRILRRTGLPSPPRRRKTLTMNQRHCPAPSPRGHAKDAAHHLVSLRTASTGKRGCGSPACCLTRSDPAAVVPSVGATAMARSTTWRLVSQ